MKQVSNLLAIANQVLSSSGLVDTGTKKIKDNVYDGYLAGFGLAIITAGLLPTLSTYAADQKREKVLNAIAKVANIYNKHTGEALLEICLKPENKPELNNWKIKIIDASIALKLMIRTYNLQ